MWIVLIMVIAMSGASGINMSMRLGKLDHVGAKQAGHVGVTMAGIVCFVVGLAVWLNVRAFGRIFTNDEIFLDLFEGCKTPFAITLVLMNMSVAIERIPYSMGRTTEVFWLGLIASWGGTYNTRRALCGWDYQRFDCVSRKHLASSHVPRLVSFAQPKFQQSLYALRIGGMIWLGCTPAWPLAMQFS
jgi:hypothetical protein